MIQQLAGLCPELALSPPRIDREERIPKEIIEKMAEIGYRPQCPRAYGGPRADTVCKVLVVKLAKQCASTAEVIAVHTLVNDIFLARHRGASRSTSPPLWRGRSGAFALTGPGRL